MKIPPTAALTAATPLPLSADLARRDAQPILRDGHHHTPRGTPSWYGTSLAREHRSWLSRTGDVDLLAGRTFPTGARSLGQAIDQAREATAESVGALAILQHRDQFHVARLYNAEWVPGQGLMILRSDLDGVERRIDSLNPSLRAIVDGERLIVPRS